MDLNLLEPFYSLAIILFLFFYGYKLVFSILKNTDFKDEYEKIGTFIFLVIVLFFVTKPATKFLLDLNKLGVFLVLVIYFFTYLEFRKEMRN